MALHEYGVWVKSADRGRRAVRGWTIFFILLIPLYIFAERPYGYTITRTRAESETLRGISKMAFVLGAMMYGSRRKRPGDTDEDYSLWRRLRFDMRGVLCAHGLYDGSGPVAQLRLGAYAGQGEICCRIGNREGLKRFQLDIPESWPPGVPEVFRGARSPQRAYVRRLSTGDCLSCTLNDYPLSGTTLIKCNRESWTAVCRNKFCNLQTNRDRYPRSR